MRTLVFVVCVFFISNLQAQDFDIVEATSQKWTGGRARSGHGVNYKLTIVCKKKLKKLQFYKLWVGNEAFAIKLDKKVQTEQAFFKNDTIILSARKKVKTNEYGDEIKEEEKVENPPVKFITEALISYKVKRSDKHLLVPKFKKLKAIYYP